MTGVPASSRGAVAPTTLAGNTAPQLTVRGVGERGQLLVNADSGAANVNIQADGTQTAAIGLSGDLAGCQAFNLAGTAGAAVGVTGLYLFVHAAPPDGDLGAGDCYVWFDPTNGAAKLMVKAKQADGTLRTGSLALA